MGIGPFRWGDGHARAGGLALGIAAALLVVGGGTVPLALAMGRGTGNGMARGRPAIRVVDHTAHPTRSTAAGLTGASGSEQQTSASTFDTTVVGIAADPSGAGYWEVAANGSLFAAGNAAFDGSMGGKGLTAPVVGVVADPATGGYWEVAADGGIFSFDAPFFGSMGGHALRAPIVGMASTRDGRGYWEVAADGGIFSFGDANFYGSMGGRTLRAPVVGMAVTPDGKGYWEVGKDGGIFSFGDAKFYGSMGGRTLRAPVTGMAADPAGGYWEVAADGGVFSFGTPFFGSMAGKPVGSAVIALAATPEGKGYWEAASHGPVYALGGAKFAGAARVSLPAQPTTVPSPVPSSPPSTPASGGTSAVLGDVPPANPPANVAPDPGYTFEPGTTYSSTSSLACWQSGTSAWAPQPGSAQCLDAEIAATDHARATEGLPPMRLPSNFSSLSPEEQLFVLTDIERVSRGEVPVEGLSALVSSDAQQGAESDTDPSFNFAAIPSSDWWGSNVVSGALNALDANYTWMYEDGYGGSNVDCTSPGASGCWGHRDNELTSNYGGTLVMGAGDVAQSTGLQCLSELLVVVQNPADIPPLSYTWADAVAAGAGG
jgi:hypothetical protein